jgi:beta-glucosidase
MTFRRGASLTTAATLGFADTADLGPTAGNGFRTRWPDDLAALQEAGVTDLQITLDWARLQPKPGTLDGDWAERFEQIIQAADAIGMRPWACLHDGAVPRWFDNDGGFGNDETFISWWPRWVERAADRFGDLVGGWVPFARIPPTPPEQPWIDTWQILAGGPPVVAAVDLRDQAATIRRYVGQTNLLGAVIAGDWDEDTTVTTALIEQNAERWGNELRDAADASDSPLVLSGFNAGHTNADTAGEIVAAMRGVVDGAVDDGVAIEVVFVEPGIAGPDSLPGLLDANRAPSPSSAAFLTD